MLAVGKLLLHPGRKDLDGIDLLPAEDPLPPGIAGAAAFYHHAALRSGIGGGFACQHLLPTGIDGIAATGKRLCVILIQNLQQVLPHALQLRPIALCHGGAVPAAMLTASQEKNAELTARVKELEDNGVLAGLTAEIDAAVADGRLPKSCEAWAKATAKTHPDAVKSYIASSTTPIAALKGTQTGGTPPDGTPRTAALTDEDRYAAKVAGISEEDFVAAKAKEKN